MMSAYQPHAVTITAPRTRCCGGAARDGTPPQLRYVRPQTRAGQHDPPGVGRPPNRFGRNHMPDPQRVARGVARRARRLRVRVAAKYRRGRGRRVPDPRDEPTQVSPLFDAGVAAVRRRMRPAGIDPDYDVAYESFDLTHFLLQARHLLTEDRDPLAVFLGN